MKLKHIFISLSLVIIFLAGCTECEVLNLTEAEKDWVNHFKIGQRVFYKCSSGKIDTLDVIEVRNLFTPCNKVELSKYQYEKYFVVFKFKSKNIYNGDEPSLGMTSEDWKKRVPYIYLGNLGPYRNDLEIKMPVAIDTFLKGVKLRSVYCYSQGKNTDQYGQIESFKSFFWDKKIGLVAYITVDDELFVRNK